MERRFCFSSESLSRGTPIVATTPMMTTTMTISIVENPWFRMRDPRSGKTLVHVPYQDPTYCRERG